MPIYAYRCDECGFAKDVLQRIADPVLTVCLACAKPSFKKQVTAAGFQLKGTGWYATDFRGGAAPVKAAPAVEGAAAAAPASASADAKPAAAPAAASGTTAAASTTSTSSKGST